jgi:hypothetical protein
MELDDGRGSGPRTRLTLAADPFPREPKRRFPRTRDWATQNLRPLSYLAAGR